MELTVAISVFRYFEFLTGGYTDHYTNEETNEEIDEWISAARFMYHARQKLHYVDSNEQAILNVCRCSIWKKHSFDRALF